MSICETVIHHCKINP